MAVKWLIEKCLFLPVWPPWRAPRRRLTLAHPAIFGLGLEIVLRLGQYGRPSLATAGLLVSVVTTRITFKHTQGHWYSCHSIGHT